MSEFYKIILLIPFLSLGQKTYSEAEALFYNKQYAISEDVLNASLIHNPNDIKSLELLGSIYIIHEDWDAATLLYQKLIKKDSTNAEYHYQYGKSMGMKATNSNIFSAYMMKNTIENEFLTTISLDKNHIDALWALIVYYNELPGIIGGSFEKAKQYANQLKSISLVDYYLANGYIFEEEKESLLAEKNYLKAVKKGGSINCYQKIISFYKKEKEYQKAISYLEIGHQKHQWNNYNFQIGDISSREKIEFDKGIKYLKIYIENYSSEDAFKLENAYCSLAKIYRFKNDRESALKWIQKSLKENPSFDVAIKEEKLILKM